MKKLIYVTKKQVTDFISRETKRLVMTEAELLKEVNLVLEDLMEFPDDNRNQIKFYSRVAEALKE